MAVEDGGRGGVAVPGLRSLAVPAVLLGAAVNSTGGILVRSLETAGDWQVVFWRALSLAAATFAVVALQRRGAALADFRRNGPAMLVGGVFFAGTLVGYVLALTHTTVANADFTMSAIPVFTAFLAWAVLRERVRPRTAIAIIAAVGGIALMIGDGIAAGTLFGNAMAILAAGSFACFVVVLRRGRGVDMLPTAAVGALIAAVAAAVLTAGELRVSGHDLALCLVWGGVVSCIAHFLIVAAARGLTGAELTLLVLVAFVLGPTWVWIFVGEEPSVMTLLGGAVVLAAVGGHALAAIREQRGTAGV